MKKLFICYALFFFSIGVEAQENHKFKFHSIYLGLGGFGNSYFGGLGGIADLSFSKDKNLFSIAAYSGSDISLFGGPTNGVNEYSLMYGREFKLSRILTLEGNTGIGNVNFRTSNYVDIKESNSIAIPISVDFKVHFSRNFGFGVNAKYSINRITNNTYIHLFLHYRFHKL